MLRHVQALIVVSMGLMTGVSLADANAPLSRTARDALQPAVAEAVATFNAAEERLKAAPDVQTEGPPDEPYLLRATYRHASPEFAILRVDAGPVATVRVRAVEFEKRATNVNNGDVRAEFDRAPWKQTPRGFVLDFRLRWNGSEWKQIGDPVAHPTLGVVGRMSLLERRPLGKQ